MKNIRCTQNALDRIMRTLLEVGFTGLSHDEQDVCKAFDAGTLTLVDSVDRTYNDMVRACGENPLAAPYVRSARLAR